MGTAYNFSAGKRPSPFREGSPVFLFRQKIIFIAFKDQAYPVTRFLPLYHSETTIPGPSGNHSFGNFSEVWKA